MDIAVLVEIFVVFIFNVVIFFAVIRGFYLIVLAPASKVMLPHDILEFVYVLEMISLFLSFILFT